MFTLKFMLIISRSTRLTDSAEAAVRLTDTSTKVRQKESQADPAPLGERVR
jgi:hypothetical protein